MRRWIALALGLLGCAATVPHEEGAPPRRPSPEVEKQTGSVPAASTSPTAGASPNQTEASSTKVAGPTPKAEEPVDISAWMKREEDACGEAWSTARGCKTPPAGATAEDLRQCNAGCLRAADAGSTQAESAAREACVQQYLDDDGKGTVRCEFTMPEGADAKYRELPALCLKQCRERGKAKLAEARSKQPAEAPQTPAGGGGDRVKCCDGTLSPTCTYSRPSLRGCCSRHGGVC